MKRLGITEWITVIALLGLIGTFAGLFFFEQNRSRNAGDEEVIGSLLFRYRVAERKFSDTVLWDRVDPGDSLRNMDWIRTDAYSEAIFELKDGSRVEMSPETMLILSFDGKEKSIQIENGSAKLDLKDSYTVKTHAETLESMKGEFRIQNKDGNLSLEKTDGTASFRGRPLEDGWYQIGKEGIKKQTSPIQLIAPIDARIVLSGETKTVRFEWQGNCPCLLQVQRSDGSGPVVQERVESQNYEASLGEGIYRWSVSNDAGQSYSRTFRLLQLPGLQVTRPLSGTTVSVSGESGLVLFSWEPFRLLQDYRLVLSKSQSLSPVLHTLDTSRTSAVLSLEPGQYYWQLKAIGEIPGQKEGGNPQTSIMPLEVKAQELDKREVTVSLKDNQIEKTTPPVLPRQTPTGIYPIYPGPGATIDMSNKDSILFRWTAMPGVQTYLFRLYRNDTILMETSLSRPYLNFTELTLLDTAWFEWSVEPIFGDGKSGSGFQQKFRITLSQTLEKPELEN